MLLVPKDILSNQLEFSHTSKEKLSVNDIVKLMAFKTIVRRLYEIQYISEKQMTKLLDIPDRDPDSGVLLQRKILQMNDATQSRTGI